MGIFSFVWRFVLELVVRSIVVDVREPGFISSIQGQPERIQDKKENVWK